MSMPSYWFDPMAGGTLGGNAATGQPAMSSAQINASMGWNPAAQAQATNIYGPQGFGGQTAQYAALGAAYGRQVPLSAAAMGSAQADRIRAIYGAGALGPGQNVPTSYGSTHNEGAPAPAYTPPHPMGQFNPHTYGWDHNEGAMGSTFQQPQQNFQDLWNNRGRVYQPPVIESPYGPGGYPPMEPRTPGQQGNLNWYGGPQASS